jgi:beta-lactamase superfamily II metal-dependent hydrolase
MQDIRYVSQVKTYLKSSRSSADDSGKQLLLGARLHVDASDLADGQVPATDMSGKTGFVQAANISAQQQLKVFYVDVGQGDGTLIEAEGFIMIIDGGPNRMFHEKLVERLESLRQADQSLGLPPRPRLRINAIVVSHFDQDHYYGLIRVLNDPSFEFGKIYHNGLPRYGFNTGKDLNLGTLSSSSGGGPRSITTELRDLASAQTLLASGLLLTENHNDNNFALFLRAALKASNEDRLGAMEMLVKRNPGGTAKILSDTGPDCSIEVLAPVTTSPTGPIRLRAFHDPHKVTATAPFPSPTESHTINGNSIVLRLRHGNKEFLFGGDLNQPAQKYLAEKYAPANPFSAEVNKACHHGSSDFELEYLKAVHPCATVFSSGDAGSYDHPLPDAMGAAAKHSSGEFPLVLSTELARETDSKGKIKLMGHINARSNGSTIVMAQKKEKPSESKTWYTFELPYAGPFGGH